MPFCIEGIESLLKSISCIKKAFRLSYAAWTERAADGRGKRHNPRLLQSRFTARDFRRKFRQADAGCDESLYVLLF